MPQKNKFSKRPDWSPQYRDKGRLVEHGTIDDVVTRMEWRFYKFLQDIFTASAVWDQDNTAWKKADGAIFNNPLESWTAVLEDLDLRDELVNRKMIFQSDEYYFNKALEYQKYFEETGKDLTQPNQNIHSVEWSKSDRDPVKVTFED